MPAAGSGPGPIAADGSPVEFYRHLPPGQGPDIVHAVVAPGGAILDLGSGPGRIASALVALGHPVTCVDNSAAMLACVRDAETLHADIEGLDLGRPFAGVLLLSQLLNDPAPGVRAARLATARRHVAPDGVLVAQHLDVQRSRAARDGVTFHDGGVRIALTGRRLDGDVLAGTMVYRHGAREWRQRFANRLLDDAQLNAELAAAGFGPLRRLLPGWLAAAPA